MRNAIPKALRRVACTAYKGVRLNVSGPQGDHARVSAQHSEKASAVHLYSGIMQRGPATTPETSSPATQQTLDTYSLDSILGKIKAGRNIAPPPANSGPSAAALNTTVSDRVDYQLLSNPSQWNFSILYRRLERFYKTYGTCNVPKLVHDDPELGLWVKWLRKAYRKGSLPKECVQALNSIHFSWDVSKVEMQWHQWYHNLRMCIEQQESIANGQPTEYIPKAVRMRADKWASRQLILASRNALPPLYSTMLQRLGVEFRVDPELVVRQQQLIGLEPRQRAILRKRWRREYQKQEAEQKQVGAGVGQWRTRQGQEQYNGMYEQATVSRGTDGRHGGQEEAAATRLSTFPRLQDPWSETVITAASPHGGNGRGWNGHTQEAWKGRGGGDKSHWAGVNGSKHKASSRARTDHDVEGCTERDLTPTGRAGVVGSESVQHRPRGLSVQQPPRNVAADTSASQPPRSGSAPNATQVGASTAHFSRSEPKQTRRLGNDVANTRNRGDGSPGIAAWEGSGADLTSKAVEGAGAGEASSVRGSDSLCGNGTGSIHVDTGITWTKVDSTAYVPKYNADEW